MSELKTVLKLLVSILSSYMGSLCVLAAAFSLLVSGQDDPNLSVHTGFLLLLLAFCFTAPAVLFNCLDVNGWIASSMVATILVVAFLGLMAATLTGNWTLLEFVRAFTVLFIPAFITACAATFGFATCWRKLNPPSPKAM